MSSVDLSNCDREPIHVPGAIQPHGVLFSLAPPSLRILQVSENLTTLLGHVAGEALGRPLAEVLDAPSAGRVAAALENEGRRDQNPLCLTARGTRFDGVVHVHEGATILELEPASTSGREIDPPWPALRAMEEARAIGDLLQIAVHEVRRLTGFERVVLYRFDEDGHGHVEAEDREP
jgi:chemotaxis family two-component system sensor kinase Cph1